MGFQATVTVLMDCVSTIQKNPKEFTDNLCDALYAHSRFDFHKEMNTVSCGHGNVAEVISVNHSEIATVSIFGGNTGIKLANLHVPNLTKLDDQIRALEDTLRQLKRKKKEEIDV